MLKLKNRLLLALVAGLASVSLANVAIAAPPSGATSVRPYFTGFSMSPHQMEISWASVVFPNHDLLTGYRLLYSTSDDGTGQPAQYSLSFGPSTRSYTATDVPTGAVVSFQVSADGSAGISSPSAVYTRKMFDAPGYVVPKISLAGTTANITWNTPKFSKDGLPCSGACDGGTPITGYDLAYYASRDALTSGCVGSDPSTTIVHLQWYDRSFKIEGLAGGVAVCVSIVSLNAVGEDPSPFYKSGPTPLAAPSPSVTSLVGVSPTSVLATFSEDASEAIALVGNGAKPSKLIIQLSTNPTFRWVNATKVVAPSATSALISDLSSSTTYFGRIAAVSANGQSGWSYFFGPVTTSRYLESVTGVYGAFNALPGDKTAIAWDAYSDPQATVLYYVISYAQSSDMAGARFKFVPGSSTSAVVPSINPNSEYNWYQIWAVTTLGKSPVYSFMLTSINV